MPDRPRPMLYLVPRRRASIANAAILVTCLVVGFLLLRMMIFGTPEWERDRRAKLDCYARYFKFQTDDCSKAGAR